MYKMEDFHRQMGQDKEVKRFVLGRVTFFGGRVVVPHADDLMPIRKFQINWLKVTFLRGPPRWLSRLSS